MAVETAAQDTGNLHSNPMSVHERDHVEVHMETACIWHVPFPAFGAFSPRSASSPMPVLAFSLGRSRDTSHSKHRLGTSPTSFVHRKPRVDTCSETGSSPDNVIRTAAVNTSPARKLSSPSPPPVLLSTPRSCNKEDKPDHPCCERLPQPLTLAKWAVGNAAVIHPGHAHAPASSHSTGASSHGWTG